MAQANICGLRAQQLDAYAADLWLLAPPCQPYTRCGLQRGSDDPRAKSLLHLLALLPQLQASPSAVALCKQRSSVQPGMPVAVAASQSATARHPLTWSRLAAGSSPLQASPSLTNQAAACVTCLPLQRPPRYLLLENVVGFERSETRDQLVRTLTSVGYSVEVRAAAARLPLSAPSCAHLLPGTCRSAISAPISWACPAHARATLRSLCARTLVHP